MGELSQNKSQGMCEANKQRCSSLEQLICYDFETKLSMLFFIKPKQ